MNVFVKGLAPSVTSMQLEKLFSAYGTVLSAKVIFNRGFAFVYMPIETEAKLAISKINGIEIEGKQITAQKALPKFKSPNDTVLPRSFKMPKALIKRAPFKDYH